MATGLLITGAALTAAYLATRPKAEPASADQKAGATEIGPAASPVPSQPGHYVSPNGAAMCTDGMPSTLAGCVHNGTPSNTPSGDTTAGDTSTTPSAGGISVAVLGTQENMDNSSSPTGPIATLTPTAPEPEVVAIPTTTVRFGTTSGLTAKQVSSALTTEGPILGLVW